MFEGLQNAAKIAELRRRLIFTFALLGPWRRSFSRRATRFSA